MQTEQEIYPYVIDGYRVKFTHDYKNGVTFGYYTDVDGLTTVAMSFVNLGSSDTFSKCMGRTVVLQRLKSHFIGNQRVGYVFQTYRAPVEVIDAYREIPWYKVKTNDNMFALLAGRFGT